ncbi:hypothetical protein CHU95_05255 [Niveispirillum lacus]|uniref:Baseplate protein J-like domain-containing protein n=1 Tax=Niveispirillum lacus TaxID=1981099 RepID=A0A255Z3Z5_9PROT|nr:hypothetical protein CHU95_05255 [Niveispirillum lacus]
MPDLAALDPASAPLDSRTARDRLAFVARFSRLIRFYTINNVEQGTWQPFMLKDAAILLATIAATDYRELNAQYQALTAPPHGAAPPRPAQIKAVLRLLRHMVSTLAHWLTWLEQQPEDFQLRCFLAREVKNTVAPGLARVRTLHQALALHNWIEPPDSAWYAALGPAWQVLGQDDPTQCLTDGHSDRALEQSMAALRHIYLEILDVLIQTVDAAAHQYADVATQKTPHPDTALLRVFVDLMAHQQRALNDIGPRHLDFYYRNVLHVEPRAAQPDEVVVLAVPSPDQPIQIIPAGTGFAAGKDADGKPLFFTNPETTIINQGRLAAGFSLKSDQGQAGFKPGIHATRLADLSAIQHDASGHPIDQYLFASPDPRPQGLGFSIASPLLLMESGVRSIVLTLEMNGTDTTPPATWDSGWRSWMTTGKGWFEAGAYAFPPHFSPSTAGSPGQLVLEWMLPAEAPALQVPAKAVDGQDSLWPQLKVALPPLASAHPWPRISAINLEIKVRDVSNLTLWSSQAPLSTAAPYPLGPVPQTGSRFLLGSREIFAKPVDRLSLTLDWTAMPADLGSWYQEYNAWQAALRPELPPIRNDTIRGSWHWREPDGWKAATATPPPGSQPGTLFQGNGRSVFTFQLPDQRPLPWLATQPALADPSTALGGYLAFTLDQPQQAFGHQIYPQVLIWASQQQAQALIQSAQGKTGGPSPPGTPNPPFTPGVKAATAEYSARCRLVPGADAGAIDLPCPMEWRHYGPWHTWLAWRSGGPVPRHAPLAPGLVETGLTLVPRIAGEGCLLLAVADLPVPCTLRLFAAVTDDGDETGFAAWRYGPAGWMPADVWHDGTAGLSASGILELSLPDPLGALPLLPALAHCAWLALTPKTGWRSLSVALLAPQAVRLVRRDVAADAAVLPPIAPGTISKAPNPTLASVRQPLASHGGRGAEITTGYTGANNFHRRVALRLTHKARALTARDYVLLAHEFMPDLFHTELLPSDGPSPGQVRLGVVPRIANAGVTGAYRPRISPGARTSLAAQLQACAADTTTVSVHNLQTSEVALSASLVVSHDALAAWPSLRQSWNLALRLYLSPWINSDQPRYDLRLGLGKADILRRIAAFPGVFAIEDLGITLTAPDGTRVDFQGDHLVAPPGQIWVSANEHHLTVAAG